MFIGIAVLFGNVYLNRISRRRLRCIARRPRTRRWRSRKWLEVLFYAPFVLFILSFLFFFCKKIGTFTISNGGVFGSLYGTPIINPPQAAILGMHATKMRAVVVNGKVEARPMMYLALTYDHRLIDGREAVTFLKSIAQKIEDPSRMLLKL